VWRRHQFHIHASWKRDKHLRPLHCIIRLHRTGTYRWSRDDTSVQPIVCASRQAEPRRGGTFESLYRTTCLMSIRHDIEQVVGKSGTLIAICSGVEGLIDVSNEQRLTRPRRLQQLLRARRDALHDERVGPLIHEGVVHGQGEGVFLKHCGGTSCNPVALVLADIALSHVRFQLLLLQDIVRRRCLISCRRIHNVNQFSLLVLLTDSALQ